MHNDQMCNSDGGVQEIEEVLLFIWAKTSWDEEGAGATWGFLPNGIGTVTTRLSEIS